MVERITLTNHGAAATLTLRVRAGTDLAALDAVRSGRPTQPVQPLWHEGMPRWEAGHVTVSLRCRPVPEFGDLSWRVDLPAGGTWSLELTAVCASPAPVGLALLPAVDRPQWTSGDLAALLLADPLEPADLFAAAGAPWYLTLFGRDSLWTARMLLPAGLSLAAGTLRTLARRQGVRHDPESEEAPGKI